MTDGPGGTRAGSPTRERIVEAAIDVFAEKGYHRAAVDDIVLRSGTSKGSFYHFFPSKEGIFVGLLERLAGLLLSRVERDLGAASGGLARVDAALAATFATFEEHRSLARILLVEAPALGGGADARLFEVHRRFADFIARRLEEARRDGSIAAVDTQLVAYAWLGAIQEIVVRWVHTGEPEPLRAAVPELRALLLRSVGATV